MESIPAFFSGGMEGGILQFFRGAMGLDQAPLATPGGVGSGGWAMLQQRQDTGRASSRVTWWMRHRWSSQEIGPYSDCYAASIDLYVPTLYLYLREGGQIRC